MVRWPSKMDVARCSVWVVKTQLHRQNRDHAAHLLRSPLRRRARGDVEVHDAPALVRNDDEHVQNAKGRGHDHEEVHADGAVQVVLKERPAMLGTAALDVLACTSAPSSR